ncbi:MAG TPA: PKD domain-containing protein [Methanosarcinales archaeon]|nr:PKD domain-containing protein [Methanosarcinales archaeon]
MKGTNGQKEMARISIVAILVFSAFAASASAEDLHVGQGQTYPTIQAAIGAASEYDNVIVHDGNYNENVDVNVAYLTVQSENGSAVTTVYAADSGDHVFEVTEDYVHISGFTVEGATSKAGIYLGSRTGCSISDNAAFDNYDGICLSSSSYNTLTGNTVESNDHCGICLDGSSNHNTLTGNTANANGIGICLDDSNEYNELTGNTVAGSTLAGIRLASSSNHNTLTENTVSTNSGYGIFLYSSSDNLIYNNHFSNANNAFDYGGTNTWNIASTPGTNIIGGPNLGGNYWSDYSGVDEDGDGLGDTSVPYDSSGGIQSGGDYLPLTAVSGAPDTTPPESVSDLNEIDTGTTWILWNWVNPSDSDFDHTEVWINGEFRETVTTPEHSYNATELDPDTTYEIGVRTVDDSDNVNQTWMNDTATTLVMLIHDINVSIDYAPETGGIKIRYDDDGTVVEVPASESLTIGKTYSIYYKIVNEGDYDETVDVTVRIENSTWSQVIATHRWTIDAGEYHYAPSGGDSWDTSELAPGDYDLIVNASVPIDDDWSNNERARAVTLALPAPTSPANQPPVSDPGGPYAGTEGVLLNFDGSGSDDPDGTIVSYEWDFGDGETGAGANPAHIYAQDGTYTVTLTVTDDDGETEMNTTTATIADTEPVADFSGTPTSGTEPLTVDFTDASTSYDGITAWEWDFGDGNTSTDQNPSNTYSEGTYTVTLTVTEADGDSDMQTEVNYITVTGVSIVDTDGDGIPDADETAGWDVTTYNCDGSVSGTYHVTSNLNLVDTDGDGLSDLEEKEGWEVSYTISTGPVAYDVQSNPEVADYDDDGKDDAEEKTVGTDPNRRDTDCDGAYDTNDGFEIDNGLNPLNPDTDGDGVPDGEEIDRWIEAGYSLSDAIANTKDQNSIPPTELPPKTELPELCPDEYRWNTSVSQTGYEWDPYPDLFRSWNDVHFMNYGTGDAYNVVATISYAPANVVIVDGDVKLGDIPAGSGAWSQDFFKLEVDMTNPQDPTEGVEWRVEYDDAAGVHHIVENVPQFCAPG